MHGRTVSHSELDELLDKLARDPETFAAKAKNLARSFDRVHKDLEISDPQSWRLGPAEDLDRPTIESQLRADVDRFVLLGREPEAQLARRI